MSDDFADLDATAQADLVRTGKATPTELVDAAIARIEARNPALNAVIVELFDSAREAARGDLPDGPFRGVPFLIKDLGITAAGTRMSAGMKAVKDAGYVSPADSFLMSKFRAAGFVTVGKTNTPELGILPTTEPAAFGPSRNPWNTEHSTGGSSGGSAAAVAAGMVPVAHANDGGGSIRIPASCCGMVGLKPSRGRVSQGPEWGDIRGGLVCDHVVSRSVRDTAAILDCIGGPMPGDPYYAPPPARPFATELDADPGKLDIGYTYSRLTPDGSVEPAEPDCVAAVEHAVDVLRKLGHTCTESFAEEVLSDDEYIPKFLSVWSAGVAQDIDVWSKLIGREIGEEDVEPCTWALDRMGRSISAAGYLEGQRWLQKNTRDLAQWWSARGHDLILTPTLAEPPAPIGAFDAPTGAGIMAMMRSAVYAAFTPPFNVTGQPAISLPMHHSASGLPIGVHIVAPYAREDLLIRVSAQLEREVGGWKMLPAR